MRKEEFFAVLGDLDESLVAGAMAPARKRPNWKAWGMAAACLCLAVLGALAVPHMKAGAPVGGDIPGSVDAGGVDMGTYSVAVFPDTEREEHVAAAEVTALTEREMMEEPLAEHLPKTLPDGFHYGRGSHYETVMKDGARYNMLRVEYITGAIPEQQFAEDGGAVVPPPGAEGDRFLVMVFDHLPKGVETVCRPEDVTASLLREGGVIFLQLGDAYMGFSCETAEAEAVLTAVENSR